MFIVSVIIFWVIVYAIVFGWWWKVERDIKGLQQELEDIGIFYRAGDNFIPKGHVIFKTGTGNPNREQDTVTCHNTVQLDLDPALNPAQWHNGTLVLQPNNLYGGGQNHCGVAIHLPPAAVPRLQPWVAHGAVGNHGMGAADQTDEMLAKVDKIQQTIAGNQYFDAEKIAIMREGYILVLHSNDLHYQRLVASGNGRAGWREQLNYYLPSLDYAWMLALRTGLRLEADASMLASARQALAQGKPAPLPCLVDLNAPVGRRQG